MIARFAAAALLAVLVSQVQAASIKWTGYANNNQWTTNTNWYPDNVPGPNDDVTIDSGYVIITTPVTVNSIGMGNEFSHMANLSVLSSLTVISTLTVDGNGNLELTSGATTVTGTVNIAGTLLFTAGSISGQWTVSSRGSANLGGGGEKVFTGCGFNSSGPVSATGLLVLNQSSVIGITSTLTASGNFLVQAQDNTAVILDTSAGTLTYTGGGTFSVQAPISFGTFNFQGGNLTLFDSVNFIDSFALPSGSVLRTLGTAVVMIPAGITGSGEVHAEGTSLLLGNANFSGSLIATAGTVAISSASSVSTLTINGASVSSTGSLMVGTLNIQDGAIQYGDGTITASTASILTAGFTLNGSVVFSGSASCIGSVLAFAQHGQVTITSGATFTTTSSVIFTGPPGTGGVINHGTLNVQGALQFQNIDLSGSGVSTVSDSLSLNTITVSQSTVTLTGNGVFKGATTEITGIGAVMGSPNVAATIGSYSFECKSECMNIRTVGIPTSNFHFKIKN